MRNAAIVDPCRAKHPGEAVFTKYSTALSWAIRWGRDLGYRRVYRCMFGDWHVTTKRAVPTCQFCAHPIERHVGRWCRVPTGAITADGRERICCCEAHDAGEVSK